MKMWVSRTVSYIYASSALLCGILLMSELMALRHEYTSGKRQLHMTVFIHGSLFTQLWPLDVKNILSGILPGSSPYVEIAKIARKNPLLWQDQALLQEGWVHVDQNVVLNFCNTAIPSEHQEKAAYLIIPSYHNFSMCDESAQAVYFLFGHLGLLSHHYRNQVAQEELYNHLCDAIASYAPQYWNVTVTIVAHSHGGNIALNLVEAEHKYRRGLVIDNLVMWGTPIQMETVAYAYAPMFKRVINCYSDGDWVQGIDTVSTKQRTCFKRLYDKRLDSCRPARSSGSHVYDVRWLSNGNSRCIGHGNMWLLGREEKAIPTIDPLPVVVLTPILLQLLDQYPYSGSFDCNVLDGQKQFMLELVHQASQEQLLISPDLHDTAVLVHDSTCKHWKSVDKSRMVLLNYQTGASLWQAFQEWRSTGYQTTGATT